MIINFNNLRKINYLNKWKNKKAKLMDHLLNLLKIYMNKYLKLILIESKKIFNKINSNLINNSFHTRLKNKKSNKL